MTHTAEYLERIQSDEWRQLKRRLIDERGYQCEHCGRTTGIELHHRTYDRLGFEIDDDLELLCSECHKKADEWRAAEVEDVRHERALDTYASKKYGEDWEDQRDRQVVEDEFDAWVERKGGWA